MNNNRFIVLLLVCAGICSVFSNDNNESNLSDCPDKCVCRKINEIGSSLKVKCGGLPQAKLTSIKEINFDSIKFDIVQL